MLPGKSSTNDTITALRGFSPESPGFGSYRQVSWLVLLVVPSRPPSRGAVAFEWSTSSTELTVAGTATAFRTISIETITVFPFNFEMQQAFRKPITGQR